jgi:hypothetical protein
MIIEARDLQEGDVWLGSDGTSITVNGVQMEVDESEVLPWDKGRTAQPIMSKLVRIHGTLGVPGEPTWDGQWLLQPDEAVEVDRG